MITDTVASQGEGKSNSSMGEGGGEASAIPSKISGPKHNSDGTQRHIRLPLLRDLAGKGSAGEDASPGLDGLATRGAERAN